MAGCHQCGQCLACRAAGGATELGWPGQKHAEEVADYYRYRPGWCAGLPASITTQNPGGAGQAQWAGNDTDSRSNNEAESLGRLVSHPSPRLKQAYGLSLDENTSSGEKACQQL